MSSSFGCLYGGIEVIPGAQIEPPRVHAVPHKSCIKCLTFLRYATGPSISLPPLSHPSGSSCYGLRAASPDCLRNFEGYRGPRNSFCLSLSPYSSNIITHSTSALRMLNDGHARPLARFSWLTAFIRTYSRSRHAAHLYRTQGSKKCISLF